jgi:hypothetical protein
MASSSNEFDQFLQLLNRFFEPERPVSTPAAIVFNPEQPQFNYYTLDQRYVFDEQLQQHVYYVDGIPRCPHMQEPSRTSLTSTNAERIVIGTPIKVINDDIEHAYLGFHRARSFQDLYDIAAAVEEHDRLRRFYRGLPLLRRLPNYRSGRILRRDVRSAFLNIGLLLNDNGTISINVPLLENDSDDSLPRNYRLSAPSVRNAYEDQDLSEISDTHTVIDDTASESSDVPVRPPRIEILSAEETELTLVIQSRLREQVCEVLAVVRAVGTPWLPTYQF